MNKNDGHFPNVVFRETSRIIKKIPLILRPSVVYVVLVAISCMPFLLHFPAESVARMIQIAFPVFVYFVIGPISAGLSVKQSEATRRKLPALLASGLLLVFSISMSRLAYFSPWENRYFTSDALLITGVPFGIAVVVALIKIRATTTNRRQLSVEDKTGSSHFRV